MGAKLSWCVVAVMCAVPVGAVSQGGNPDFKVGVPAASNEKYATEPLVFERMDTVYRYALDGTGSKEITGVMRMQSDAAARQFSVFTIPFAANNERVEIDYIRARKPNGSAVETPVSDAQEMPQEVTRQAPFYSDLKEKQIPVRNLQSGDRLEYKARIVRQKAETPGEFWGQEGFGNGVVILAESVELHVPKAKYVKVWSPQHPATVTEAGDEKIYRWTGSQLKPTVVSPEGKKSITDTDDTTTKEIDPEGELAPVAWTTFKSWEAVGAWYRGLEGDRMVADAEVKAKVAELTAGKTSDEDKVRALYDYVSTRIRYIGVALGIGRYQPHPAGEVLRNQYGDCKDKHTLLAAMLSAAGFHPEASLIGPGIRMNEEVPSPGAFNHLITALPLGGGTIWLDSTTEIAPYRMLMPTVRDKRTLLVPDSGSASLQKTPATLPFTPFTSFTATGTLAENGTAKVHIEYVTRGDDELVVRAVYRQVAPGQWDQLTQNISQRLGFGGTTSHAEASRPDVTKDPEKVSYDYEREKLGDWDNFRIIPLMPAVFLSTVDEKDPPKQAIELGQPHVDTSTTILTLPEGWGAELPAAVHERASFANFDKTYTLDHDTLTVVRRIEILQKRVPRAEWKSYKKWMDATLSGGEPYIQLTSNSKKTADKAPPPAGSNNADAAKLVSEAHAEIQRGEINKAQTTLDSAKMINPKQVSLWSTYGYLNYERRNWTVAIESYAKELDLFPDTYWVYQSMARAQINSGKIDDAIDTLRKLLQRNPENDAASQMLAAVLIAKRDWAGAETILAPLASKSPDNLALQMQLGKSQIKSGKADQGRAIVVASLKKADEPSLLNNGAYILADEGLELPLAEQSAKKAVELLTLKSADWKIDGTGPKEQKSQLGSLLAAWDTLGWILYREGHVSEAEGYIRAAWLNMPSAEVGLHLGEILEKETHLPSALKTYEMALSLANEGPAKNFSPKTLDPVATKLHQKVDELRASGLKSSGRDSASELQALRTLPVGRLEGGNVVREVTVVIHDGKAVDLHSTNTGNKPLANGDSLVKRAIFSGWTPPNSSVNLVRTGTLNCHSGVCEFILLPM